MSILSIGNRKEKERATKTLDYPVYESMSQAANHSGVPLGCLRKAKRNGCPAFLGSRINMREFIRWYFNSEVATEDRLDPAQEVAKLNRVKRELAEIEKQEKEKTLITMEHAIAVTRGSFAAIRSRLDALPAEGAALSNPSDPVHARKALELWVKDALRLIDSDIAKLE